MLKTLPFILLLSTIACSPPGPTPEEIAANKLEKKCARLYEAQTKVFRDALYKQQIPEDQVKFADKADYTQKCIEADLSAEQMACIDPNLRDPSCTETMKDVTDKETNLKKFLFGPMSAAPAADPAAPAADPAATPDKGKE